MRKRTKMKKLNHRILAEGEATGHAHRATAGTLYEDDRGSLILDTEGHPVEIIHEEHGAVLPLAGVGGRVRIGRVQEMDHAEEAARQVVD